MAIKLSPPTEAVLSLRTIPSRPVAVRISVALTLVVLMVNGMAPMSTPFVVVASATLQLYWALRDEAELSLWSAWSSTAVWVLPFLAWCAASLTWTTSVGDGLGATLSLGLFAVAALTALAAYETEPADVHHALVRAILAAYTSVAVYRAVDQVADHAITNAALRAIPVLASLTDVVRDADGLPSIADFATNKSVAWLVLLLFPILLALRAFATGYRLVGLRLALAGLVAASVTWSHHESSKLALLFGGLVFVMATWHHRWTWRSLAAGWMLAIALAVPLALMAWRAELHRSAVVQSSGQHRVVIWGVTAERTLKAPLTGYGLASTRYTERAYGALAPMAEGTSYKLSTNLHAHNIFLQTWHELGAIGAILLLIAGWPVLRWLRDTPPDVAPYALATFGAAGVVASLSWSLVAAWFTALFAFVAVMTVYAARTPQRVSSLSPNTSVS